MPVSPIPDALGRRVAALHDGPAGGSVGASLDGAGQPAGVYVVRATSGTQTATARLVVARSLVQNARTCHPERSEGSQRRRSEPSAPDAMD